MKQKIETISEQLLKIVEQKLHNADVGHDIWHIRRVLSNAMYIQSIEGGNGSVVILSAVLHDLVDEKYFDVSQAVTEVRSLLRQFNISSEDIESVLKIITNMSFSKEIDGITQSSPEFNIVKDADRLDAIGAIGIARAFSYGNQHRRPFFDPESFPVDHLSSASYRSSKSPTINHFFEKLLQIPSKMMTHTGREMALEREGFMTDYLQHFFDEWRVWDETSAHAWNDLLQRSFKNR